MSGTFGHVLPLRSSHSVTELSSVSQGCQSRNIPTSDLYKLPPLQTSAPSSPPDASSPQDQMPGRPSRRLEPSITDSGRTQGNQEKLPSIAELLSSPIHPNPAQFQQSSSLSPPTTTPDIRHSHQAALSRTHRHMTSAYDVNSRSNSSYAEGQHQSTPKLPSLSEVGIISRNGIRPPPIPEGKLIQ